MPKTNPEHEAYVERAQAARAEQAERLAEHPPQRFDYGLFSAQHAERRARIEADARRGDLNRWAVEHVAECFSDSEIPGLLEANTAAAEQKARAAERRREHEEVKGLAKQIEREREEEARRSAEEEARRRLGVEAGE